jgi:hypothetical protein
MTLATDAPTKCYRLSKAFRNRAILLTVCFFAAAVANFFLFLVSASPANISPLVAASIVGGFYLAWTLLALYLLALHHRYRLWLSANVLRQRGVCFEQMALVAQIKKLKWQLGVRIRSEGSFGAFRVELDQFERADRDEIVSYFRRALDDAIQIGRTEFDAIYFPDPQVVQAREKADRQTYRRIANLVLCVSCGYVIAWFIYPWFPTAMAAVLQLLFGGVMWIRSRRATTSSLA